MKTQKNPFKVLLLFIAMVGISQPVQAQTAYEDEYAALLARMVEKGSKEANEDFLEPVEYWSDLWDRVKDTDLWTQMMNNAKLFTAQADQNDATDITYALLTRSDNVAWLAFPGANTDKALDRGTDSEHITWPGNGNTDASKDVHENYYHEWTQLQDQVTTWLTEHDGQFDKLVVTGHSRGAVLAQYFVADYADDLSDKVIDLVLFGSPNGGSQNFIKDWAASPNLLRAKVYTTEGHYTKITGGTTEHDIILSKKVEVNTGLVLPALPLLLTGKKTYYPRGMSREDDFYLTDCATILDRQNLSVSGGKWSTSGESTWYLYSFKIHDDSYYLSGLQGAVEQDEILPLDPTDTSGEIDQFAITIANRCIDGNGGKTDDNTKITYTGTTGCSSTDSKWIFYKDNIRYKSNFTKCLDLDGASTSDGAYIEIQDCNTSKKEQKWFYDGVKNQIRVYKNPKKCIGVNSGELKVYSCDDGRTHINWEVSDATVSNLSEEEDNVGSIRHTTAGRFGFEYVTSNSNVCLWKLWNGGDGDNDQKWYFYNNTIRLNKDRSLCVDLKDGSTSNGTYIQAHTCDGSSDQGWFYDGFNQWIRSIKDPDKCIDLENGTIAKGTKIQLYDCTAGNTNMQWVVEKAAAYESDYIGQIKYASATGQCVDNKSRITENGNNIQSYECKEDDRGNQTWWIKDQAIRLYDHPDWCIDLEGGNTSNGSNIQLYGCKGSDNQQWIFDVNNQFLRSSKDTDKCIDLENGNTDDKINIQLYTCQSGSSKSHQQWNVAGLPTSMPTASNQRIRMVKDPTKCIDIKSAIEANNTNIQIYTCKETDTNKKAQRLKFDGEYIKMQSNTNYCLDLYKMKDDNNNNIQLYRCNGTDAQKWIYDALTKAFRLKMNMKKCLNVEDGSTADRTNVLLYDCNGSTSQQFEVYADN